MTWKGVAVLAWLVAFFLAERWRPAARPRTIEASLHGAVAGGWHRLARNLGLWLAVSALSPLIVLPLTYWASGQSFGWRPEWWSGGLGLAFDILLLDGLIYWWHQANHRIAFLWRFHEVHHLDRFLDTTSALRFHFGEVLLSALARAGIILLLGFPFTSVLVFETLVICAAVFHHSNVKLPAGLERGLSRVVITPSIHWVHHHALRADTDSNYGTIFSFWDPLFGTRSPRQRDPQMIIGTEGRDEEGLVSLFLRPFRRR